MRRYEFGFFAGPRYPKEKRRLVERWEVFAVNCREAKRRAVAYLYMSGKLTLWPGFIKIGSKEQIECGLNEIGKTYLTNNSPEGK